MSALRECSQLSIALDVEHKMTRNEAKARVKVKAIDSHFVLDASPRGSKTTFQATGKVLSVTLENK